MGCQQPPEARKEALTSSLSDLPKRNQPCWHPDFGLLDSRSEIIFCCFKALSLFTLLQQTQETNTLNYRINTVIQFCAYLCANMYLYCTLFTVIVLYSSPSCLITEFQQKELHLFVLLHYILFSFHSRPATQVTAQMLHPSENQNATFFPPLSFLSLPHNILTTDYPPAHTSRLHFLS